jgi:P27 family predicted phage terminase small subunit
MSRKPLSEEHHALHGTRPTRAKPEAPPVDHRGRPKRPSYLNKAAKKEWARLIPLLESRGTLTELDGGALALHCVNFSRYLQAQEEIEKYGIVIVTTTLDSNGSPITSRKKNPAVSIASECERAMRSFLRELGLTPDSREKIRPAGEQPAKQDAQPTLSAANIMSFRKKQ